MDVKNSILAPIVEAAIIVALAGCGRKDPSEAPATQPTSQLEPAITTAFTGHGQEKVLADPATHPASQPVTTAAQEEEYQAVDPSELHFGLTGLNGLTVIGEGGTRVLEGTFKMFLCEGSEVVCTVNTIDSGIINTREYGRIKVSTGTFGGLTVYVTTSQKEKLLQLKPK